MAGAVGESPADAPPVSRLGSEENANGTRFAL